MKRKKTPKNLILLLKQAVNTLVAHPKVFIPFITIAFIQLLALELFLFSSRYPLSGFFNPIVSTLWGAGFTRYPGNLLAMTKMFQLTQIAIYIFLGGFFISAAIAVIGDVNEGRKVRLGSSYGRALKQYVHILVGAFLSVCVFFLLYKLYGLAIFRAMQIRSVEGPFFILKTVILKGTPYFHLLIGIFVTTLFAFVFPSIMLDKKKIFAALGQNIKFLFGSFWYVFLVILVPTLLYLTLVLLRGSLAVIAQTVFPEIRALILLAGIFIALVVDATVYTALTMYYLLKKENA